MSWAKYISGVFTHTVYLYFLSSSVYIHPLPTTDSTKEQDCQYLLKM